MKKTTQKQIDGILKLSQEGWKPAQIGSVLKITPDTVYYYIHKEARLAYSRNKYKDPEFRKIVKKYNQKHWLKIRRDVLTRQKQERAKKRAERLQEKKRKAKELIKRAKEMGLI